MHKNHKHTATRWTHINLLQHFYYFWCVFNVLQYVSDFWGVWQYVYYFWCVFNVLQYIYYFVCVFKVQNDFCCCRVFCSMLQLVVLHMCCILSLQHTATHCNALQRTATHCNTLVAVSCVTHVLHSLIQIMCIDVFSVCCSSLQVVTWVCIAASSLNTHVTHCNTLQHTATHCNTLQHI